MKNVRVIGVIDLLVENRRQALRNFKLTDDQISDNIEKLLSSVKPDAILDCSPPFAHYQNTLVALNKGCHILGEKPISLNLREAQEVIDLSLDKKRIYMVNQNYRRNPIISILRKNLSQIGRIYSINIDYFQGLEFKDTFRYSFDHPLLLDMAIHHFDLVRMITDQKAKDVFAQEYNPETSKFKNGSGVVLQFGMDKGTVFSYRGAWSSKGFNTSYNGFWRIIGEYGTIIWDGDLAISVEKQTNGNTLQKKDIKIPKKYSFSPYEVFLYELRENLKLFVTSIHEKKYPDCWCGDNIYSLKMVLSAIESSEKHKTININ
jgi:predicted dehydrogenase